MALKEGYRVVKMAISQLQKSDITYHFSMLVPTVGMHNVIHTWILIPPESIEKPFVSIRLPLNHMLTLIMQLTAKHCAYKKIFILL